MLHLRRVLYPTDFMKCNVSGELISWGDYYYYDDEQDVYIRADVMKKIKNDVKLDTFSYEKLNNARSLAEFKKQLRLAEKEYLSQYYYQQEYDRVMGDK